MLSTTGLSVKVLIVEERNILREKIAGILSREDYITMVVQVSSYSKAQTAVGDTDFDIVLGDVYEFNKFCKEKGISAGDLYPDAMVLLYTDEYRNWNRIEAGHLGENRVFDVLHIQEEVKSCLLDAKQRKQSDNNRKGGENMSNKKTIGEHVDEGADKVSKGIEKAKDRITTAKEGIADAGRDLSKSAQKAASDMGDAVGDMIHSKE